MHQRIMSLCLGLIVLTSATVATAAPRIRHALPHGGKRGTEVKFTITGDRLDDAQELMLYDPGCEVVSFTIPEDPKRKGKEIDVVMKVAADCPLGSQRMRIRGATGISKLFNFWIGPLPVVEEKEPNSEFDKAEAFTINQTIHGLITNEDVDYFDFDAKKGERINVEVVGLRLGVSTDGNFFDPYVAILDSGKFELVNNDDSPLGWNDAALAFVVPEDGRYTIQVRDVSYAGDGNAYYMLHVGNFPRPSAIFPLGGKPGELASVKFLGDPKGEFARDITPVATDDELTYVEAVNETGSAPTRFPFRVNSLDNVIEQEPNNSVAEATVAPFPGAWNGRLETPGDTDFYKFKATKGQVFDINVYGRRLRSPIDSVIVIRNPAGGGIASNDDNRNPDSYIRFTVPADGEYTLEIYDQLRRGGVDYSYRIEARPVSPTVSATTAEIARYILPQFVIPQGGGYGVQMQVSRQNIGGAVRMLSENLPEGVTVDMPAEWSSDGTMPLVLRSTPEAPLSGKWATLKLEMGDPAKPESLIHGLLKQDLMMVRGRNAERMWEETQIRMPVVVTKAAPFKVRIEAPKIPVVQGGGISLKVVVERQPEFKAPIRLNLLQNPPGCSSNTAAEIPAEQNEAIITLNAAANAPVRMSPIAVRAMTDAGGYRMETCSEFVPLSVEAPFLKFEFQQAAVEQGKETQMLIKVDKQRDFEGEAIVTLVGLPAKTEVAPLKLTKDQAELVFNIKAATDTPAGTSKDVICQVQVPMNGEMIAHSIGSGRLRVDPPPKAPAVPAPVAAAPKPAPATPPKPISRLEQLRLEQKAREEAAAQAPPSK